MQQSGLQIEHQCPQCGAPVTLEETDHLLTCGFCRVKSFLVTGDIFRYVLPHNAPEGKNLIYAPYWRFKGMLFTCLREEISHRIVDVSNLALDSRHLPATLGLRCQTLKLRFMTPEMEGRFLRPHLRFDELMKMIENRFYELLPKPIFHQSFIGDTLSQIYAPFYVDSRIHDAVLNRPVSPQLPEDSEFHALDGGPPPWRLQVLPALCPNCGWDLEGERDSLVLLCRNCKSAWQAGKKGFTRLNFASLSQDGEEVTYLPFYRISAEVTGITLDSYADLIRVGNLPKVVQHGWDQIPFRFWFPAFKVRPSDLLKFSQNLTLSQPQENFVPEFPGGRLHPVTLSIRESVEGLKTTLASFIKPPGIMFPKLSEIHIRPESYVLIYLPFHLRGNELSQPAFRLRINRNLLSFARAL